MFKRIYGYLMRIVEDVSDVQDDVDRIDTIVHGTYRKVSSMETWIELLADTKADAVAEEFERLLKEHHSSGQKTTNTVLKELVHQAVLNSK